MPSAEYYRRQAEICVRLSLAFSDEKISAQMAAMGERYRARAEAEEQELTARSRAGREREGGRLAFRPPLLGTR
jgi:hypothetical protein